MRGSPVLFWSIHPLILGNLSIERKPHVDGDSELDPPFVLLPDVVLLAEVDKVGDRLRCQELKAVDNVNL